MNWAEAAQAARFLQQPPLIGLSFAKFSTSSEKIHSLVCNFADWHRFRRLRRWWRAQRRRNLTPIGRPKTGTGVPSRTSGIGAVIAGGDTIEMPGQSRVLIEQWIDESGRPSEVLVDQSDQSGPKWSYGACASHDTGLPINEGNVTSIRVGNSGYIGNPAADVSVWVG